MNSKSTSIGDVNTPRLLFYNQNLKKLAPSRCGFANYFATCEQLVLIYRTNSWLGCKKNIIILLKKSVLSLTFLWLYASPNLSSLQNSLFLSTLCTSPCPQPPKLFSLSTLPRDLHDFRWWVLVMAHIRVWVGGCGWSLGQSVDGLMIVAQLVMGC